MVKYIIILFFLGTPTLGYSQAIIRVLLGFQNKYQVKTSDPYTINNTSKKFNSPLTIAFHKKGILVNNKLIATNTLHIQGIKYFSVDGNIYRGSFTIHQEKNTLSFINNVSLEEYLLSVVPSEVYTSWHSNALKAQAIAARTYALYEVQRNRRLKKKYDVYDDTRSQVYLGVKKEFKKTSLAVLSTKGQVLTHQGKLIKSYFSSSVGGISADGTEIGDNKPYLKPVKTYLSSQNPSREWTIKIPLKKIQQQYKTTKITDIGVGGRTPSGRIDTIKIKDSQGKITTIDGEKFRSKIGTTKMKSTLAQVKVFSGNLVVRGRGYGHGVGMGQWEAQELARRGAHYSQILKHFYKGTSIQNIYKNNKK